MLKASSSGDFRASEEQLSSQEEDALLRDLDLPTIIYIKTLKAENASLKEQLNVILNHNAGLWEEKIILEEKVNQFSKKHEEMLVEIEVWKESATSLEHKSYVMNQLMDDLASACNSLYDNLQAVVHGRHKYSFSASHLHQHFHEEQQQKQQQQQQQQQSHEVHEAVPERGALYRRKSRMFGDEKKIEKTRVDKFVSPQMPDLRYVKGSDLKHVAQKLKVCVDISTALHRVSRVTQ